MSWWATRNWCLAHGKSLASLSDLGITGGYEDGYCDGDACTGADWDALTAAFGYSYYWTNYSYDSCLAFIVGANDQTVGNNYRFYNFHFALCR